jgi:hypothetical protein
LELLKILRSLEEFLYEAIIWLVMFPRTMWRVVRAPLAMDVYARREINEKLENQFTDSMSPPLFLLLTIGLGHVIALAFHIKSEVHGNAIGRAIFGSQENLLIYRAVGFSIWALVFSSGMLRRTRVRLDRETLRAPFFGQCLITAPFALGISMGATLATQTGMAIKLGGMALSVLTLGWYLVTQYRWVRSHLGYGKLRSAAITGQEFLLALAINVALAWVLTKA